VRPDAPPPAVGDPWPTPASGPGRSGGTAIPAAPGGATPPAPASIPKTATGRVRDRARARRPVRHTGCAWGRRGGAPRPPRTVATVYIPRAQPPPEPHSRAPGWRYAPSRLRTAGPPPRPLSPVARRCLGPAHREAHGDSPATLRCD